MSPVSVECEVVVQHGHYCKTFIIVLVTALSPYGELHSFCFLDFIFPSLTEKFLYITNLYQGA